jgi:hypothetical protein
MGEAPHADADALRRALVLVNKFGAAVSRKALSTIWQTLMNRCVELGVIAEADRFGLHDARRQGITDTQGTRADKRESSGHRTDAMMDVCDLSVPRATTPAAFRELDNLIDCNIFCT